MGIVTAWRPPRAASRKTLKAEIIKMLAPFGGIGVFIMPGDRVMLKPDLAQPSSMEEGLNTNRELVAAVAELAQEAGAVEVVVAESAEVSVDTINNFCLAKYDYMCEQCGAELMDLKETAVVQRPVPQALLFDELSLYQPPLLADVLINLPALKVRAEGLCGAHGNLLGLLPDQEKDRLRGADLERGLFDLSRLVTPDLTIVDGMRLDDGEGEQAGVILAGADMVALDTISAALCGLIVSEIEYLVLADQYGQASARAQDITIYGDDLSPLLNPKQQSNRG